MTDVSLELIDVNNWREVLEVRVADDQLAFVADHQPVALGILAKCYVRPGGHRWEPILVRHRQSGATFVNAPNQERVVSAGAPTARAGRVLADSVWRGLVSGLDAGGGR